MAEVTTLTIEISASASEQLERLANRTCRKIPSLAAEAVSAYAQHELAAIEAIERGREQARNGQTVSQEEAFAEIFAMLGGEGDE